MEAPDLAGLKAVLERALGGMLDADEVDVIDVDGGVEVMTDDWTLRCEGWPDGIAFLTIEDEPEDAAELRKALRVVMPVDVERALAAADQELGGGLTAAMRASADPLSVELALALAEHQASS